MSLENTVAKYTVQIVQDGTTATAVQEFNNLRTAAQAAAGGTETATGSLRELRETSMLTRESTRILNEAVIMLGGTGLGEVAKGAMLATEGLRGARTAAMLFGLSVSEVLIPLAAIAAAVGGGYLLWQNFTGGLENTTKASEELVAALDKVPALLQKINELQKAGLVSGPAAGEFGGYLNGSKKLYVQPDGTVGPNPSETTMSPDSTRPWLTDSSTKSLPLASQAQINDYVGHQLPMVSAAETAAVVKLNELVEKARVDALSGIEQEKAKIHDRYEAEREEILKTAQAAGNLIGPKSLSGATVGAVGNLNTAEANANSRVEAAAAAKQEALDLKEVNNELQQEDFFYNQVIQDIHEVQAADKLRATQEQQLGDLEQKITLDNLTGEAKKQLAIQQTTQAMIAQFTKLAGELGMSQEEIDQWIAKIKSAGVTMSQSAEDSSMRLRDMQQLGDSAAYTFSSGMANAFVQFAQGTESAGKAFTQFATGFLQQVSTMILETLILKSIMGIAGSFGGGSSTATPGAGDANAFMFAGGGVRFAASGYAGMISSPTYFPRFNVIGGEAGGEMAAILARPTMRSIGGIDAVVGHAGNQILALTNAADLSHRGGAGGLIRIQVNMHPDLKAEIIHSSVKGAQVQIAHDLTRNSPIAKGVKQLTA